MGFFGFKKAGVLLVSTLLTTSLVACQEDWRDIDYTYPEFEVPEEPKREEHNPELVEKGWTNVSNEFGELPAHIDIYRSPATLEGVAAVAYIAVADLSTAKFDVWSIHDVGTVGTDEPFLTPSEVYATEQAPVVINGGYFFYSGNKHYSSSLAVRDSELLATNVNYASEDWVTIYTPTRGALLQHADGSFEACWTYYTWDQKHYTYPNPAPNSWAEEPQETPTNLFPEGAEEFEAVTAIGGGPVLVRDGEFRNTYIEEMFDGSASGVSPESRQPRTAVGVTADGRFIAFVCEGREMTEGVFGLSTAEVARVMMELGCVEALNLDGGGSTCMLVNGLPTIQLSDGEERAVGSTVMLK